MLEQVKKALRIASSAFDGELSDLIDACKMDLTLSGVAKLEQSDPLIKRAITLYAKANYGFGEDSEKFQRSYDLLKCSLCLAGDYHALE